MQRASFLGLVLLVAALSLSVSEVDAQLSFTYYQKSCPNVETIIFKEVQKAFKSDPTIAPGLLRMMFHDCFVRVSTTIFLETAKLTQQIWTSCLNQIVLDPFAFVTQPDCRICSECESRNEVLNPLSCL